MADLSGVPRAGRIVEILRQLQADPGALGAAAADWTAAGAAAASTGDAVAGKANALDGAWEGAGADAVVGYATQLRTAFEAVEPAAKAISSAWNPVDNIIAGVCYSISRYGSVSNVPGVAGCAAVAATLAINARTCECARVLSACQRSQVPSSARPLPVLRAIPSSAWLTGTRPAARRFRRST